MQQASRGLRAAFVAALLAAALVACALPGVAHAAAGDTWYVTANLYCPAAYTPPGIDVYLTNSANPIEGTGMPSSGITEATALLTDNGDGTYTLVVQVTNPALTLQSLGSGDGAISVVGFTTSSSLVWWDESAEHEVGSRIASVTFLLASLESSYTISGCTIYATPLSMSFTSPVILVVDLSGVDLDASEDEAVEEESEGAEAEAEDEATDEDEAVNATEDEAATESESDEDAVADNDGGDDATADDAATDDAAAEIEAGSGEEEPATGDSDGSADAADETESTGETSENSDSSAAADATGAAAAADDAAGVDVAASDDDASDGDVVADEEPAARQATALALARLQQLAEHLTSSGTTQLGCALENALKG